jgi:flagellar biosynthetic protein FliR
VISFTSTQLNLWIAAFLFPLARIMAFIATAPILSNRQIPNRVKIGFGFILTIAIAPTLNAPADIEPGSASGMFVLLLQILIGVAMGFAMRLVFTAIEMAGEIAGLQIGLGFASFYDPQRASFTPILAQFLGVIAALAFLTMDGHLYLIATLAESFNTVPIAATPPSAHAMHTLALWGGSIFVFALQLSLPILAALLITNLAMGILSRSAPQVNLFAIGFPITLAVGFIILALSMSYFAPLVDQFAHSGLDTMQRITQQMKR